MADPNAGKLFRTNANVTILVSATGYAADSVVQSIAPGVPAAWSITQQPGGPTGNGGTLVTNPVVSVLDQWGNTATNASGNVTAAPAGGAWFFGPGSGTNVPIVNGAATFTNLSAASAASVPSADITFTTGSFAATNSSTFSIPAPVTSGFGPTNLVVFQEDAVAKNSTFSILEVNPVNSSLVHTFPISATGSNALRTSSAATTGRMSDSGDGTLVCFTGFETQDGPWSRPRMSPYVNPRGCGDVGRQRQLYPADLLQRRRFRPRQRHQQPDPQRHQPGQSDVVDGRQGWCLYQQCLESGHHGGRQQCPLHEEFWRHSLFPATGLGQGGSNPRFLHQSE